MKTQIATLALAAVLLFIAGFTAPSHPTVTAATGAPPITSEIRVQNTPNPSQVIVSWKAVAGVSHYRIAYVNMDTFDALRRSDPAADWRQAVMFSDLRSTDANPQRDRGSHTIDHLVPGDPYAFTVLTANDHVLASKFSAGNFHWPHPPAWTHHQVPPIPTSPPVSTITPTQTPTPTPTPTPGVSRQEPTATQYDDARQYMLQLINEARAQAGVSPVALGTNPSAQQHADDMQAQCFISHWGSDGLKPYMRYTLAGGHQASSENNSKGGNCFRLSSVLFDPTHTMNLHMYSLLNSPGHRATILDPDHAKVNIGIKVGPKTEEVVQVFEHDDVTFTAPPAITDTVLTAAGRAHIPTPEGDDITLRIRITHHRPPHALTDRQLASTYAYGESTPVAVIDIPSDTALLPDEATFIRLPIPHILLPDPYDAPAQPPLTSYAETSELREAASAASANPTGSRTNGFLIEPARRDVEVSGTHFSFEVDIADVLTEFGPGVYTVVIEASSSTSGTQRISTYSVFRQVEPPAARAD